ncbi:MAG: hypothetical protein J6I52_06895 [Prevotella sp.]|nr:hypothetical protein [Prevotella sp.]
MSKTIFFNRIKKAVLVNLLLLAVVFSARAEVVFSGEHAVGSWNAQQLPVGDYPVLAKASAGDVIAVTISDAGGSGRVTLQDVSWSGFADEYDCADGRHYFVLTEAQAQTVAGGGLIVTGENYTLTQVELLYKKALWEGSVDDNSGWTQSDALSNDLFAGLSAGDVLGIDVTAINDGESWHQVAIRVDYADNMISASTSEAKTLFYELTADHVTTLQTKTINVIAQYLKVSALYTYAEDKDTEEAEVIWTGSQATGDWSAYVDLSYDNRGSLSQTFKTDVLRITFTTTDDGAQIQLSNPAKGWAKFSEEAFANVENSAETQTFEYTVANASVLEDIQLTGIIVQGKNINVTKVELVKKEGRYDAVPATIGEDGIATFSSSKHLSFAEAGITPYYASEINDGSVTLTPVDNKTTWGHQGYVLRGAEGSYDIPVIEESEAAYPSGTNYLKATSDYAADLPRSEEAGKYLYIFAKKGSNIGFYHLGGTYKLAAHRAYLCTDSDIRTAGGASRGITLRFGDDETTSVRLDTNALNCSASLYTLSGQRVKSATKGIYISEGKKIIIK